MEDFDALLNSAGKPDEEALTTIFDLFAHALYEYAFRLTNDPIQGDAIVGDVFAGLIDPFRAGKHPGIKLRTYLYQNTYRLAMKHLNDSRSTTHREITPRPLRKEMDMRAEPKSEEHAGMEALFAALDAELTDDQRHIVILGFLDSFSIKEIAQILGREPGEVKMAVTDIQNLFESHPELLTGSLLAQWHLPGDDPVDAPPPANL